MNIRRFVTFAFVFAIAVLIAGLSACDQIQQLLLPAPSQMEGQPREISIGVVSSQTGYLGPGEFGLGSLEMEHGLNMALEEINSQRSDIKLKFIVVDDRSSIEGAVEAFNKLIHQDKVPVILGVWTSHIARSVFPIAQENQVVAFAPVLIAAGLAEIGDFIFRSSHNTEILIPHGVKATQQKLGYQRVATISDRVDFFSVNSDAVFKQTFADSGIKVVASETFATGDTDFSAQLTRIKESNPDAVFVSAQHIEVVRILTQGRQLGIPFEIPFISMILSLDEIEGAGDAAEGVITFTSWVGTADTPGNQAFVQNHRARYGIEPSVWAALSYAGLYILAEGIAEAQSNESTAIRDALANITDFDTILGKVSFNEVGDAVYDPVVMIVKDGELQIFE